MRHRHQLIAVLLAVAVLGVGSAALISLLSPTPIRYEKEWLQALLQAGLIATLGVVIAGVLELFKDGLQRSRDDSKLRFGALKSLERTYMDVKLIRRAAQAAGSLQPNQLSELNERQVLLELQRDNSGQFPSADTLFLALSRMEKYLNRVANKPDSDERKGFLNASDFRSFAEAYKQGVTTMRKDIASHSLLPLPATTSEA